MRGFRVVKDGFLHKENPPSLAGKSRNEVVGALEDEAPSQMRETY
jgi:hypothetical protein